MNNNFKITIISMVLLFVAIILQSTLVQYIAIYGVKPDLSLIILVYISFKTGSVIGQSLGFFTGIIEDIISFPPIGVNALIRTTIGFLSGLFQGSFTIDPILLPIIFIFIATIIKGLMSWVIITVVLGLGDMNIKDLFEIVYNCLLAPIIFALLNKIKIYSEEQSGKVIDGRSF